MHIYEPFADRDRMLALAELAATTADHLTPRVDLITSEAAMLVQKHHAVGEISASATLIRRQARQIALMAYSLRRFSGTEPATLHDLSVNHVLYDLSSLLNRLTRDDQTLSIVCTDNDLCIQGNQQVFEHVLIVLMSMASACALPGSTINLAARLDAPAGSPANVSIDLVFTPTSETNDWPNEFRPVFRSQTSGPSLGLAWLYGGITQLGARLYVVQDTTVAFRLLIPGQSADRQ